MPTYNGARAQRALMDRQAEIQKQRDEQLSGYQQTANEAAGRQQQQTMGLQAGYQAEAMRQQAGIQQQRDSEQFGYQTAGTTQQAGIQQARDQLLIKNQQERDALGRQHEAAMQEAHVRGQMDVYNNQLSQGETLRLQRLKQQLGSVDEAFNNGTLSASDANDVRMQLQTSIDPLQRRMVQTNMANEQARTQAIQQQTTQGATEFNRRQAILAQTAQQRMQMVEDPVTGLHHLMQMDPDGRLIPLEMNSAAEGHLQALHGRGLANLQAQQNLAQGEVMNPLQFQAAQQHLNYLRELNPLQIDRLRQDISQGRASHAMQIALGQFDLDHRTAMAPGDLERQRLGNVALNQQTTQAAQMFPAHLASAAAAATIAEQEAIIRRAHAAIAPEAAALSLQHSRGAITLQELQARHSQLLNAALEYQLQGNLTDRERQDAGHQFRSAAERELQHYQDQRNAWIRNGSHEGQEPPMPAWLNVGFTGHSVPGGQLYPGQAGHAEHAMTQRVSQQITALATERRAQQSGFRLPAPLPPAGGAGQPAPNGPAQPQAPANAPPQGGMPPPQQGSQPPQAAAPQAMPRDPRLLDNPEEGRFIPGETAEQRAARVAAAAPRPQPQMNRPDPVLDRPEPQAPPAHPAQVAQPPFRPGQAATPQQQEFWTTLHTLQERLRGSRALAQPERTRAVDAVNRLFAAMSEHGSREAMPRGEQDRFDADLRVVQQAERRDSTHANRLTDVNRLISAEGTIINPPGTRPSGSNPLQDLNRAANPYRRAQIARAEANIVLLQEARTILANETLTDAQRERLRHLASRLQDHPSVGSYLGTIREAPRSHSGTAELNALAAMGE